ncbi:KH domain-containing protein [Patescibacteria group bacterium]|nr:MAG: KH domain-containing protein [Patescibacteria group bacterium]
MAEKDQEFVEYMVRSIVNHPDDVRAERTIDERGVLITLHVNPEDMGYVIGREGQTARSLRTLLRIVGAKSNARVNLKIYEPEEARQARMAERGPRPGAASDDANRPDFSALDDLKI